MREMNRKPCSMERAASGHFISVLMPITMPTSIACLDEAEEGSWGTAVKRYLAEFWRQWSDVRDGGREQVKEEERRNRERGRMRERERDTELWYSCHFRRTRQSNSPAAIITEVGWLFTQTFHQCRTKNILKFCLNLSSKDRGKEKLLRKTELATATRRVLTHCTDRIFSWKTRSLLNTNEFQIGSFD